MEKAAQAMKRSATRLMSPSDCSELSITQQHWKESRNLMRKLSESQQAAADSMLKWALGEENRAIRDVVFQMNELTSIYTQIQNGFVQKLGDCLQQLETISENSKLLSSARKELSASRAKESKLAKDIRKPSAWLKGGDLKLLENQLEKSRQNRAVLERKYHDISNEVEVIKMVRVKACLSKLAEAQLELSAASTQIFEAQRDVAAQIPDVIQPERIREMHYTSAAFTRDRVAIVRDRFMLSQQSFARGTPRRATVGPAASRPPPRAYRFARRQPTQDENVAELMEDDPPPPYSPFAMQMDEERGGRLSLPESLVCGRLYPDVF